MKRSIDAYLLEWKESKLRKPLLIRGARQVGKTHSVKQLGKSFEHFVAINFELEPEAAKFFELDLNPDRIVQGLSLLKRQSIIPGKTLLFLDEIQAVPRAITALRYFYEHMPALHVIAAGSLIEFALEQVGIPVGRVDMIYMFPMSFLEFLQATDGSMLVAEILQHALEEPMSQVIHDELLRLVGSYLAIGGMPEVVGCWVQSKDFIACSRIHNSLLEAYKQDFNKYAKKTQIKYLNLLFKNIPHVLGKKFKYSEVGEGVQARDLEPSLDLLERAGVIHRVIKTSANGSPLGVGADLKYFKVIFLDVALCQKALGQKLGDWLIDPFAQFINKGSIVEAFVGQELLAYADPRDRHELYFWQREKRGSDAEVDYLIAKREKIIPIEVKSGSTGRLKSLHIFLESHPQSPYGIRFSAHNYSIFEKILSYPLYAVSRALQDS